MSQKVVGSKGLNLYCFYLNVVIISPMLQMVYSGILLYGHPLNTETSK